MGNHRTLPLPRRRVAVLLKLGWKTVTIKFKCGAGVWKLKHRVAPVAYRRTWSEFWRDVSSTFCAIARAVTAARERSFMIKIIMVFDWNKP